jgi:hypothetical protein
MLALLDRWGLAAEEQPLLNAPLQPPYVQVLSGQVEAEPGSDLPMGDDYTNKEIEVPGFPCKIKVRTSLSDKAVAKLQQVLAARREAFAFSMDDLATPCKFPPHHINTGDSQPFQIKPYKRPEAAEELMCRLTWQLVRAGICEPTISPYSSEMLLVEKDKPSDLGIDKKALAIEDRYRGVQDYRCLNERTLVDACPMPTTHEKREQIGRASRFTRIDLRGGFYQVDLAPEDRHKTAFRIRDGLFCFRRMPMGLRNSPATFCRGMDMMLRDLPGCCSYFDDAMGTTVLQAWMEDVDDAHIDDVDRLLARMIEWRVKANPLKCVFAGMRCVFTGFILEGGYVKADPQKTRAIRFLRPQDSLHATQVFLGAARYYAWGIPDIARLVKTLTRRLKKGADLTWTPHMQEDADAIKQAVVNFTNMWVYRPDRPVKLASDYSHISMAATASQMDDNGVERPMFFASRACTEAESKLSACMGEVHAFMFSVQYFWQYCWGRPWIAEVDHQALTYLQTCRDLRSKVARFSVLLQELLADCTILYKPGRFMGHVDSLSRTVPDVDCVPERNLLEDPLDCDHHPCTHTQGAHPTPKGATGCRRAGARHSADTASTGSAGCLLCTAASCAQRRGDGAANQQQAGHSGARTGMVASTD